MVVLPGAEAICGCTAPSGCIQTGRQIVLYEYQKTCNASHPRGFLKDFNGVCVTDGYQVYHTVENEREDLKIAGCWPHARRRLDEAVKALPKAKQKDSRAYLALTMIQAICREEKLLKDLPAGERKICRQLSVFEYLLTEIPKHLDDTDRSFLDDLLPWSPNLPANCRKPGKEEVK